MYCRLYSVQEDTEADNGLFPIIKKQTANHRIRRTNVAGYVSLVYMYTTMSRVTKRHSEAENSEENGNSRGTE